MIYTIQNRLGEINWDNLQPGDQILIPPKVYPERIRFSSRGAAGAGRIKVRGLIGPNGERAKILGTNAVTDPQFIEPYEPIETFSLVNFYHSQANPSRIPGYVDFIDLDVASANSDQSANTFTGQKGNTLTWSPSVSAFYLLEFENVGIIGCKISDCGNGIFSHDGHVGNDLLIENCDIFGHGKIGSYLQHSTYVQCVRPIYRNNRYGPLRFGSFGGSLKDRSADVLIEGNTFRGGTRMIDISDWQNIITDRQNAPNAGLTRIINNLVILQTNESSSSRFVYFENGRGTSPEVRSSRNTYIVRGTQGEIYYINPFLSDYTESVVFNSDHDLFDSNTLTGTGKSPDLRLFSGKGHLNLGPTWTRKTFYTGSPVLLGSITGVENIIVGGDPGYVSEGSDYNLINTSPANGFGYSTPIVVVPPPPPPLTPPPPTSDDIILEVGGKRYKIAAAVV